MMKFLRNAIVCVCLLSVAYVSDARAYDKDYIGQPETHRAVYEDTFVKIARNHGLGFVEMRAANPDLDPWIPGAGAKIKLPKRHLLPEAPRDGIIINLPEMRLYFFPKDGEPVSYPIGIGRDGLATPEGTTKVTRKKEGPTWRPTSRMRKENPELPISVPPGPKNPLGSHALYLGWPQYLIHGTNKPYGIGRRVSSGCIRLYPEDIIELFAEVSVKTPVHVVDQPIKAGWVGNEFYVEMHPIKEEADFLEENLPLETTRIDENDVAFILEKAADRAEHLDWDSIREAAKKRQGYPVMVASRPQKDKQNQMQKTKTATDIIEVR